MFVKWRYCFVKVLLLIKKMSKMMNLRLFIFVSGNNVFVVTPTEFGKSLLYLLPSAIEMPLPRATQIIVNSARSLLNNS